MILNYIDKTPNIIDNKVHEIKEIKDVEIFLNNNHIEGFVKSSINIGLYFDNELISLMTFNKRKDKYKLLRFCNKINTKAINDKKILFDYFLQKYKPFEVEIILDRSYLNIYESLGFKLICIIKPTIRKCKYTVHNSGYLKLKYQK